MPDYFSHNIIAELIYEKSDNKYKQMITSMPLYLLGAQGGDVYFAYNINFSKSNLGRNLHRRNALYMFEQLKDGNPAYAAGFATHYVLDYKLHPFVYAYEAEKRSPVAHQQFEADLGLYISRKYGVPRRIIPREKLLECTGPVYDSIKLVEPTVTVTGVERCLKRHFNWTKLTYRFKRQEYRSDFKFETLAETLDRCIELGVKAVACVLDKNIDPELFGGEFLQK